MHTFAWSLTWICGDGNILGKFYEKWGKVFFFDTSQTGENSRNAMKYRPQLRSCSKTGKWIELAGHWHRWMIIPFYARIKSDIDILPAATYQYSDEYKQKTATSTCAWCLMLESRVSKLWPACQTGLRSHFVKSEKINFYEKFFDLVECNISRNNHIT